MDKIKWCINLNFTKITKKKVVCTGVVMSPIMESIYDSPVSL